MDFSPAAVSAGGLILTFLFGSIGIFENLRGV
jgi:hypothetical protein